MRLIPNNISIFEQFIIRDKIDKGITKWAREKYLNDAERSSKFVFTTSSLETLEQECGIKCVLLTNGAIGGFEMTNEKTYAWFTLKYL